MKRQEFKIHVCVTNLYQNQLEPYTFFSLEFHYKNIKYSEIKLLYLKKLVM